MLVLNLAISSIFSLIYFLHFGLCNAGNCVDKSATGKPSDCPRNKQRCEEPLWKEFMQEQCPKTCGKCRRDGTTSETSTGEEDISRTVSCVDGTGPNGVSECPKFLGRCRDPLWSDVMRKTCAKSCGFCSSGSSTSSADSLDTPIDWDSEDNNENQFSSNTLPFISITDIPFTNGWTVDKLRAHNASTGSFVPVEDYLPADYIKDFLRLFQNGVSFLMTESSLYLFGREMLGKPDNSQFVIPHFYMDLVLAIANDNISVIESELGIPAGHWRGQNMVRIDVAEPSKLNLRMATGNEEGANQLWLPGGLLPNGIPEAVIDNVPAGMYTETTLHFPRWMPDKWTNENISNDAFLTSFRHFMIPLRV